MDFSLLNIFIMAVIAVVFFFIGVLTARRSKRTNVLADRLQLQLDRLRDEFEQLKNRGG